METGREHRQLPALASQEQKRTADYDVQKTKDRDMERRISPQTAIAGTVAALSAQTEPPTNLGLRGCDFCVARTVISTIFHHAAAEQ